MKTHEQILEELRRIATGDSFNDPMSLASSLRLLAIEVERLIK